MASDQFKFSKEKFYAASRNLTPLGLYIWCYLADGHKYNKDKLAQLYDVHPDSIRRAHRELVNKRYIVDNIFSQTPREIQKEEVKMIEKNPVLQEEKEVIRDTKAEEVTVKSINNNQEYFWKNQF